MRASELNETIPLAVIGLWKQRRWRHTTIHNRAKLLRHFLGLAERITQQPGLRAGVPKLREPEPRAITATNPEATTLLDTAPAWLRCYLLLCIECGLRRETAVRVAPSHYDKDTATITIDTKNQQTIRRPASPRLQALFAAAEPRSPEHPYWHALRGTGRCTSAAVYTAWKRLKKNTATRDLLRLHDLRRTCACRIYEQTHDLVAAQAALGHRSMEQTVNYLRPLMKDDDRNRALAKRAWFPTGGPVQ